ncbi:MAG: hypothetical protein WBX01_13865 [Nitrososphaeraceae archaeon]
MKNISSSGVKTFPEFEYYPTYDDADPNLMFAEGIDLSEQDNIPGIEIIRDDGFRIRHIRVRGSLVEAMATINEMDGLQ